MSVDHSLTLVFDERRLARRASISEDHARRALIRLRSFEATYPDNTVWHALRAFVDAGYSGTRIGEWCLTAMRYIGEDIGTYRAALFLSAVVSDGLDRADDAFCADEESRELSAQLKRGLSLAIARIAAVLDDEERKEP